MEPRNMYVQAYEERIKILQHEQERNHQQEEARRIADEAAEEKRRAEEARCDEEMRQRTDEERARKAREQEERMSQLSTMTHQDALSVYNKALFVVWADGAATVEEEDTLKQFRVELKVSGEEHSVLEAAAKRECYIASFKQLWSSGSLSADSATTLSSLRRKFRISADELEVIESELLNDLRSPNKPAGNVLIIDDDKELLRCLALVFEEHGFSANAYLTSDEAYQFLRNNRPDIIISDINLETSTMGGFAFYEKVRQLDHLNDIPFIFLSGLHDDAIIQTGKELGADDYITKPFDEDSLVAAVKGKLRRYARLRLVSRN
jgi:CheY-like chemotaxis protein